MAGISRRYDFVYIFDVTNGNPNGDPDAGNRPRVDPDTNRGLVSDVCLKRKVRNYVAMAKDNAAGFDIYMQERAVLNQFNQRAYDATGIKPMPKKLPKDPKEAQSLTKWMCDQFYDIRAFGAVMTTDINTGQVRGPIQLTFAQSVEPVTPLEISITRSSVTNERDIEKERTMGSKYIIPYGLYRAHGFISGRLANDERKGTGFSDDDLQLFWRALEQMFDHDRSASRGEMSARKLIVFEHESDLGNAPAHILFDRVKVKRRRPDGGLQDPDGSPPNGGRRETLQLARSYADYDVQVDDKALPAGITVSQRL